MEEFCRGISFMEQQFAAIKTYSDRLLLRQDDISDAGENLIESQKATRESFTTAETACVNTIDTSRDWQQEIVKIIGVASL